MSPSETRKVTPEGLSAQSTPAPSPSIRSMSVDFRLDIMVESLISFSGELEEITATILKDDGYSCDNISRSFPQNEHKLFRCSRMSSGSITFKNELCGPGQ